MKSRNQYVLLSCLSLLCGAALAIHFAGVASADESWSTQDLERRQIEVEFNGGQVAVLHYGAALDKPYFHPIWTPTGQVITFDAPADHVHHRGLSLGWPDISGANFWSEVNSAPGTRGRIVTESVETHPIDDTLHLTERNRWLDPNGEVLLSGIQVWTFHPPQGNARLIDVDLRFEAIADEVVFGSDPNGPVPYHGLCLRIGPFHDPVYFNSEGVEGGQACQGVAARWMAVRGLQFGRPALAAIFDHPENDEHPTPFYVQDQGMQFISTSPNHFEPKRLAAGETWRLRYRVIAAGNEWDLEALWNEYEQQASGE